jgi:hypothetical protein
VRLFGTKKALFLAAIERCFDLVAGLFREAAAAAPPGTILQAMGEAYIGELENRERLLFQLQSYAASADDEVRQLVRRRYRELWSEVAGLSGASPGAVQEFFSIGMLLTVGVAIGVPEIAAEAPWARDFLANRAITSGSAADELDPRIAPRQEPLELVGRTREELEADEPATEGLRLQTRHATLDHAGCAHDAELEPEDVVGGRRPPPADRPGAVRRRVEQDQLDRLARRMHAGDRLGDKRCSAGGQAQRAPSARGSVLAQRSDGDLAGSAGSPRELDVDLPRAGVRREPAKRERGARMRRHGQIAEQERRVERLDDRRVHGHAALGAELDRGANGRRCRECGIRRHLGPLSTVTGRMLSAACRVGQVLSTSRAERLARELADSPDPERGPGC